MLLVSVKDAFSVPSNFIAVLIFTFTLGDVSFWYMHLFPNSFFARYQNHICAEMTCFKEFVPNCADVQGIQ